MFCYQGLLERHGLQGGPPPFVCGHTGPASPAPWRRMEEGRGPASGVNPKSRPPPPPRRGAEWRRVGGHGV